MAPQPGSSRTGHRTAAASSSHKTRAADRRSGSLAPMESHARQLTHPLPGFFDQWPHFTPDGQRVLFTNFTPDVDGGISSIRPDGTHLRVITPNSGESYNDAVLSPNGRRLAFMRWHVGNATMRVYTRALGGGRERPVTPVRLLGWWPDWAPDGHRILFSSNAFLGRPNAAIYTVGSWGGSVRKLTHPEFPNEDWSAGYARPVPGSSSFPTAAARIASSPERTSTPCGRTARTSTRSRCRPRFSIPMHPNGEPLRSISGAAPPARQARGSGIRAVVRRSARRRRPSSPSRNASSALFDLRGWHVVPTGSAAS